MRISDWSSDVCSSDLRQTDLVVAAARATLKNEGLLHVKKAQFLAPWDCHSILRKIEEADPGDMTILCERGSAFGYNTLVVAILAIPELRRLGAPATIEANHATQLPGAPRDAPSAHTAAPELAACRRSECVHEDRA